MIIVVMGPQGSGKSTQAQLLAKVLGLPHLQTGELARQKAREKSAEGREFADLLRQGKLLNDSQLSRLLQTEIAQAKYQGGFVIDGAPRRIYQAQHLPFKIDQVIYLRVGDEENVKRLSLRGRADDTSVIIQERLRLYYQETEPILDFYRQQGLLIEIDGERSVEAIHQDILSKLKDASKK